MRIAATALAALLVLSAGASAQSVDTTPTAPPGRQLAQGETAAILFPALIEHSRHVASLHDGRLRGEGGAFLRALGAQSQFVLIGEDHFNSGIAQFTEAYWRELSEVGYRYAALEIDPWTAARLTREVRAGGVAGWSDFIAAEGGVSVAPFLQLAPEAELAATVATTSSARDVPALWGLDQVFNNAGAWMSREIADGARDPEARRIAAALAADTELRWLGRGRHAEELAQLRERLGGRRDRGYQRQVAAMQQTQRIYAPFLGGPGEAYFANLERETLMRRTFEDYYARAERSDRAPPRVLIKLGSNHAYRGPTPTGVPGFGGFTYEFADARGGAVLSVLAVCGPGGEVASMTGGATTPCGPYYQQNWSFLAPYTDPERITIFDLRVWKLRLRRWEHIDAELRQGLLSFDLIVVVPNTPGSPFLPGARPAPD